MRFHAYLVIGSERIDGDPGGSFASIVEAVADVRRAAREIVIGWLQSDRQIPPEFFVEIVNEEGRVVELISPDALLLGRNRPRQVFQNVHHPYLLLAPDFTIIEANPAFLRATMTDLDRIARRNVFQVFPGNPDDPGAIGVAQKGRASLQRVLTTKSPDFMTPQRYDIRRPNGSWEERHWRPVSLPVLDDNGEIDFIIHSAEDVTAQLKR